jgi:Txe/YoeB family toxin of Txe-Axe toxin-antitoxin module
MEKDFIGDERLKKKYEEYVADLEQSNLDYYTFFSNLKAKVRESYSRMKNIDRLGSFEADDETGFIFKELKDIAEQLNGDF